MCDMFTTYYPYNAELLVSFVYWASSLTSLCHLFSKTNNVLKQQQQQAMVMEEDTLIGDVIKWSAMWSYYGFTKILGI